MCDCDLEVCKLACEMRTQNSCFTFFFVFWCFTLFWDQLDLRLPNYGKVKSELVLRNISQKIKVFKNKNTVFQLQPQMSQKSPLRKTYGNLVAHKLYYGIKCRMLSGFPWKNPGLN
jgi:hypothetical protein